MGELWHGEVERAAYRDGHRLDDPRDAAADLRVVWVQHPDPDQVFRIAHELEIPTPIVQRTREKHGRARVDRDGHVKFFALRPAR